ncbi:MAG: type II toxin-antitoxin system RelE/ParE family toxin [Pseudomonadota bacterium]
MFEIVLEERVIKTDIPKLSKAVRLRVQTVIEQKLTQYPDLFGKPLRYDWRNHYSGRVGDYRILYRIEGQCVFIVAIQHRKDVYH